MSNEYKSFEVFVPIKVTSGALRSNKKEFSNEFCRTNKNKPRRPLSCELSLSIVFYFIENNNCDIDNLLKNLFDALQKDGFLSNDKVIKKINVEIRDNDVMEGVRVIFKKYQRNLESYLA